MRLSDAFPQDSRADVEVHALALNINEGCNEELIGKCPELAAYARMIARIRELELHVGVGEAVRTAVAEAEDGALGSWVARKGSAMSDMFIEEYDEEFALA